MKRAFTALCFLQLMACGETGESLSATIGPSGGSLRGDGVTIHIPSGALDSAVEIRVEPVPVPTSHRAAGGSAYRFRPEGLRFAAPVTVRFALASGEESAGVFWSSDASPATLERRATQIEGREAVAQVDHFSIGFAGWALDDTPDGGAPDAGGMNDGGPEDGGSGDGGSGDGGSDDGGSGDGGSGDAAAALLDGGTPDGGPLPGITCVVTERGGDCSSSTTTTYTDVPFSFHLDHAVYHRPVAALTSPLAAFNTLYNTSLPAPFGAVDAAGSEYSVSGSSPDQLTRAGLVLTADFDAQRQGNLCLETPDAVPLVRIRCTGTTRLPEPECMPVFLGAIEGTPLTCSVTRRDSSCVATTSMETPRFWLTSSSHGPESELHTDSSSIAAIFAAGGVTRFYREGSCDTYVEDVRDSSRGSFGRVGDRVGTEGLVGSSSTTCLDELGRSQPTLSVSCAGMTTLVAPP